MKYVENLSDINGVNVEQKINISSAEQKIVNSGNKMYMIYESGAMRYRTGVDYLYLYKAHWQFDRIAVMSTSYIYK